MGDPILDIVVRSLPALLSLVFSFFSFKRSLVVLGIEANSKLCCCFESQKDENFSCVGPGTNALSVTSAVVALATSLIIAAILTEVPHVRILYGIWAPVLFCGIFGYVICYKHEIFKVEEALISIGHGFWGNRISLGANLITATCSIIFAALSLP